MWPRPSPSTTSLRCSSVSVRHGTSARMVFRLQSFSSSPRSHVVVFVVHGRTVVDVNHMSVADAAAFFAGLRLSSTEEEIASLILSEIRHRLRYLLAVGLDYLTLDRQSRTLSGGELARVDLTTAV